MGKNFNHIMIIVWSVIALILIAIFVFFFAWQHSNFSFNDNDTTGNTIVEKTFSVGDISKINVNVSSSDINFVQTQGNDINVKIQSSKKRKDMFSVENNGGELEINQKTSINFFFFNWWWNQNKITISLPASYSKDLALVLASGDLKIRGNYSFGDVSIKHTSGDISGDNIKANSINIKSTSGDMNFSSLDAASIDISNTSGDETINSFSGSGSIHSISGELHLDVEKLTGALDVSATSGNVNIGIAKNISAEITGKTVSGNVNTNFPVMSSSERQISGKVGSGPYNSVSVNVVSGNIGINQD